MSVTVYAPGVTVEVIMRDPVQPGGGGTPPQPPVVGKIPVLGNQQMHQQQGWMADWIDAAIAAGVAKPWTLGFDVSNGILAKSLNGAAPKRTQAWHLWGNPSELYSQVPYFDSQGRSHPYSPETSDDIKVLVADFKQRPPRDGPRGICMPISQATVIPHPTMFPPVDATLPKTPNTGVIPRHPLVMWLRHDAVLQFGYADGRFVTVGAIPGIARSQDGCIDGRFMSVPAARKILYVCDMGDEDAAGRWSGGRIARVDRLPGAVVPLGTPEDPSKYVVTTFATASFPSAVRSDETGAVYFIDGDKGGEITVVPFGGTAAPLVVVPGAFAMDYAAGKLYVMCVSGEVHIVDIAARTVGPNLMPANGLADKGRNADFFTISVDANGTCGLVGSFMCSRVHTNGNTNSWHFGPGGVSPAYGQAIYGSAQGWNTCGDAKYVHELFGHYDWLGGKYHTDQAIQFVGGYANCPLGVLVFDPWVDATTPAPLQAVVDYTAIWRGMLNLCLGGPVNNFNRPSLTALMTREGWSPFRGCSNDELAEMSFDALEAFIHQGYVGSFRRDDIVGVDLYCVMLLHLVNSQTHIREGAACVNAFKAWWAGKGRALPPSPAAVIDPIKMGRAQQTTHTFGSPIADYRLEVRETAPGSYRIGIFGNGSNDILYSTQQEQAQPIPADAVIIVDQGMPTEQVGTAGLTTGWHAFTVRAAGWNTGAVTYYAP